MISVVVFIIGLLCGAILAFLAVIAGYGTDAEDYYEGSKK